MPIELQVLKAQMQSHGLAAHESEVANNIIKKIIEALFDDDSGGCSSCQTACSPGCQPGCVNGCSGGNQNG